MIGDQNLAEATLKGIRAVATEKRLCAAPAEIEKWLREELGNKNTELYKICFPEKESEDSKRFGDLAHFFKRAEDAQGAFGSISRKKKTLQTLKDAALDLLILTTLHEINAEARGASSASEEDLAKMLYCRGCCATWWSQEAESQKEEWREFGRASFREAAEKGLLEALYMLGVCQEIEGEGRSGEEADGYCADDYYAAVVYLSHARAYLLDSESEKPVKEQNEQSEQDHAKQKLNRSCAVVDQTNSICKSVGFACKADTNLQKISAADIKTMLSGDSAFLVRQDEKWWKEGTKNSKQWRWRDLARDSIRNKAGQQELKK